MDERWFISYRFIECDFLTQEIQTMFNGSIVTNITPARWICEHGKDHHIMYAEKISLALASELIHGGAGIPADYYDNDH